MRRASTPGSENAEGGWSVSSSSALATRAAHPASRTAVRRRGSAGGELAGIPRQHNITGPGDTPPTPKGSPHLLRAQARNFGQEGLTDYPPIADWWAFVSRYP